MRVPGGRAGIAALAGLALAARAGTAQIAANRAASYLAPSDVTDARALWVNPAGLAVRREASVLLDLTVVHPGRRGRLGQLTAGFNARGLSFGYQRDNFANGVHGHTYRLGLAGSSGGLAAGLAIAVHRGATGGTGLAIGTRYDWSLVTVAAVLDNVGRPTVRGVRQEVIVAPAVTVRPLAGSTLALSAQAAYMTPAVHGYGIQARAELPGLLGLGFVARLETDRSWRRTALTVGLSLGRADRVGLVGSTPGDASHLDATSVYGVSSRIPTR